MLNILKSYVSAKSQYISSFLLISAFLISGQKRCEAAVMDMNEDNTTHYELNINPDRLFDFNFLTRVDKNKKQAEDYEFYYPNIKKAPEILNLDRNNRFFKINLSKAMGWFEGIDYHKWLQSKNSTQFFAVIGYYKNGFLLQSHQFEYFKPECSTPAPVPLPGSIILLGSGLFGLLNMKKKIFLKN